MPKGPNNADWLYFIECGEGGPIKIGIASCVLSRMANLRSSNPHLLSCLVAVEVKVAKYLESELHRRFIEHRIHGEWFSRAPEIDELIVAFRSGNRGRYDEHRCTGRALVDGYFKRFFERKVRNLAA